MKILRSKRSEVAPASSEPFVTLGYTQACALKVGIIYVLVEFTPAFVNGEQSTHHLFANPVLEEWRTLIVGGLRYENHLNRSYAKGLYRVKSIERQTKFRSIVTLERVELEGPDARQWALDQGYTLASERGKTICIPLEASEVPT